MRHHTKLVVIALAGLYALFAGVGQASAAGTGAAAQAAHHVAASSAPSQQQALDALAASNPNPPTLADGSAPSAEVPTTITPNLMSDCPSTWFCVWVNAGWEGGVPPGIPGKFQGPNPTWAAFSQAGCPSDNWNNCASSGWNRDAMAIEVWQFANYTGASACLKAGWQLKDFAGYIWPGTNIPFNDSITSNQVRNSPNC